MASVSADVKRAIEKNRNARSYQEWRSSGYLPSDIFKLIEDLKSKEAWGALCQVLSSLKSENLALFDQEIRFESQAREGFECRRSLSARLDRYWKRNEAALAKFIGQEKLKLGMKLSFSGGPHLAETPRVLEILKNRHISAVFFEDSGEVKAHPELTRSIVEQGYGVGLAGGKQVLLSTVNLGDAEEEIRRGREQLKSAAGVSVSAFLLPVGATSVPLRNYVESKGFKLVDPDFDPEDWKHRDSVTLFKRILEEIRMQPNANILLHDRFEQTVIVLRHLIAHGE